MLQLQELQVQLQALQMAERALIQPGAESPVEGSLIRYPHRSLSRPLWALLSKNS